MSVCTSIEKHGVLSDGTDVLKVTIDDTIEALWCYSYADALQFLNQEVIVEYFLNIYEGTPQQFIKSFIVPRNINVIEKQTTHKLFTNDEDNASNVEFRDIDPGVTQSACIVFCVSQEVKSSPNAIWVELRIRDKTRRVSTTKIFDVESTKIDFTGKYVLLDLTNNPPYGFRTQQAVPYNGAESVNPEITVAKEFVSNFFINDPVANTYISSTKLLDKLDEAIDYEKGYAVVRLAQELCLAEQLYNMTQDINVSAIIHAILASYGHYTVDNILSADTRNILVALNYKWPDSAIFYGLLDKVDCPPQEYTIYRNIKNTVNDILITHKEVKQS